MAQTVKRLPAMWETWAQSLGWEDLLEKEMATHSSILAWKIPWMVEPGRLHTVHGVSKSETRLSNFIFTFLSLWKTISLPFWQVEGLKQIAASSVENCFKEFGLKWKKKKTISQKTKMCSRTT